MNDFESVNVTVEKYLLLENINLLHVLDVNLALIKRLLRKLL